jgi:outer membrane protein TolC
MAQADQQVENAAVSRRSAWGAFLPSLSASSGASLRSQDRFDPATDRIVSGSADSYNAGLSAGYDLFTGGRRFADLDRSRADLNAAEARREEQRFAVTLQTEQQFFAALKQGELLEVARSRLQQAEESMEMTRRQSRVGLATASDTLRARLEMVNARQAVLQAETGARNARFALGRHIGADRPVRPTPPEGLAPAPLALSDSAVLALAERASPSVRAAEAASAAAGAAYSAARTQYLPTLRLSTGYSWANDALALNGGNTSWSLAVSGSYPIFNGFQREGAVDRAEQTRVVARLQETDARLAARQEADAALLTLATAASAIEIAEEAVRVAEEDLRVVRERYRVGVATVLDVVTSQIALDQARVNLVGSRYDYVTAKSQLEAILGREL